MKFRFSLHYASLCNTTAERREAFSLAKDLYDLRSKVVHGGSVDGGGLRLGNDGKVSLGEAAKKATGSLRKLVHYFLPDVGSAPYKKAEYWEKRYLAIGNE